VLVSARNLAGDAPFAGLTTVHRADATFLRFDMAARRDRPDAFMAVYSHGGVRVVIRAEASLLPQEDHPSLALVSAERALPAPPVMAMPMAPPPRKPMHHRMDFE